MFGNIAYLDNMRRAANAKMGMLEKARGGTFPSKAPVGYRNTVDVIGQKRTVTVDPVKAPLVRLAFELYAQGRATRCRHSGTSSIGAVLCPSKEHAHEHLRP